MAKKKVIKSASGNYRATQRPLKGPAGDRGVMNTSNTRRTIKGVLSGAPTVNEVNKERNTLEKAKLLKPEYTNSGGGLKYLMTKKRGGVIKNKK